MNRQDFIGKGLKFPVKTDGRGRLAVSGGPDRVADAIWLIIATVAGERVMRPSFGASAPEFVFANNAAVFRTALADEIRHGLATWEPRIDLQEVRVEPVNGEESQVLVAVHYRLRATNELFNTVYPLHLEEGVAN